MTDTSKLTLSRRNMKGGLTRTLTAIEKLVTTGAAVDTQMLQNYVKKAEEQFQKVENKHDELVENITDEEAYAREEQWMADCEQTFLDSMVHARKFLESRSPDEPPASHSTTTSSPAQPTSPGTQQASPTVTASASSAHQPSPSSAHTPKMTRMKFPTFSGAIEDYERFKEFFQYCTQGLTEMETFFQLTESMINQKERIMVKSCATVDRAWEVLDARYGDQDRLVDSLLRDLDNLKPYELKGKINIQAMTRFIQILQNFECRAESMGLSGELNSKIMLSSIKQKLPEEHRMGYYQSVRDKGTSDSLSGLTGWLREQLLLIEKCRPTTSIEDTRTQSSR